MAEVVNEVQQEADEGYKLEVFSFVVRLEVRAVGPEGMVTGVWVAEEEVDSFREVEGGEVEGNAWPVHQSFDPKLRFVNSDNLSLYCNFWSRDRFALEFLHNSGANKLVLALAEDVKALKFYLNTYQ